MYILNELTSIVENLVVLGYEVPEIFVARAECRTQGRRRSRE
ncbi:MAG: phage holin family protein [Butyricicoccaceae bacterium]